MTMPLRRIAVLGDIHGNRPALQAVLKEVAALAQPVDLIVAAGDLWSLGPEPSACLKDLLALPAVAFARGNHDRYMLGEPYHRGIPSPVAANIEWHREQISPADQDVIRNWPLYLDLSLADCRLRIAHATPFDDEQVVFPDQANQLLPSEFDGLVLAHVHQPWVRYDKQKVYCNCGSVGAPLDGDHRASWLIVDEIAGQLQVTLQRTSYDVEETVHRLLATDAPFKEALAASLRAARIVAPA